MHGSNYGRSSRGSMMNEQIKKQDQIVDQNFAHGTLFMVFSTLEQIKQAYDKYRSAK